MKRGLLAIMDVKRTGLLELGFIFAEKIMKRLDHGIRIESELGKGRRYFLNWEGRRWIYIRACSEKNNLAVCMPHFSVYLQIARLIFYML